MSETPEELRSRRIYEKKIKKKLKGAQDRMMARNAMYDRYMRNLGMVPCYVCGTHVPRALATLEHVVPLSKGGADNASNYAISHDYCNQAKADAEVPAFAERRGGASNAVQATR